MISFQVKVNPAYSVVIGRGAFLGLGEKLKGLARGSKALIVTDSNVKKLYLDRALQAVQDAGLEAFVFTFAAGEQSKTPETYLKIIDCLGHNAFKRTDTVLALGGGVVGDVAGFAAATYMRGIDVVQLPTTLLAMIDSSVGGKTGVDLSYGKNLLGAFYQPRLVLADTELLETLPEKEWINGLGEGVKYACLAGGRIARIMSDGLNKDNIDEFVYLCASYKADVVCADEKESGLRRLLNLGHTVGHALEKRSDFKIPHGLAVANGISVMANAAFNCGELKKEDRDFIADMLKKCGVEKAPEIDGSVTELMAMDKKSELDGDINAVLIRGIGRCEAVKMKLSELAEYIYAK